MRRHSIELFSDYFAQATNILTLIDARVKLVFVLATLTIILFSNRIDILFVVTFLCVLALLMVKIPFKMILARLVGPLVMAGAILILQSFFFGETQLYSVSYAGISICLYKEGLVKGLLIAGRVLAGTSLILFLSMTTPINMLLGALKYFRVPGGWLEIMVFTYRYIFVFIEEAQSIMDAQRLRLGYGGMVTGLKSWGVLVGSLFTRVYDQANATHAAMVIRGYNGTLYVKSPDRLRVRDISAGFIMAAVVLLLLSVI